jgi:hypothetical protein
MRCPIGPAFGCGQDIEDRARRPAARCPSAQPPAPAAARRLDEAPRQTGYVPPHDLHANDVRSSLRWGYLDPIQVGGHGETHQSTRPNALLTWMYEPVADSSAVPRRMTQWTFSAV